MDEVIYEGDDAGLGHRLTKAIKRAIFGGPEDTNLPDEHPGKDNPAIQAGRQAKFDTAKRTQNMDRLKDFGRRVSGNAAVQNEITKAKKRAGKSELEATREAITGKDE